MSNTLKFTIETQRVMRIEVFSNRTQGSGSVWAKIIDEKLTKDEICKIALKEVETGNIPFRYWVTDYEVMTDNREEFGHENCSSEKQKAFFVPITYIRGKIFTLEKILELRKTFSENVDAGLWSALNTNKINIDSKNLTPEELATKIVMINGNGRREDFFEILKEGESVMTPEDVLVK